MKKATNRILSFLTAFAMVIGVLVAPFTSANAAGEITKSVTVHKILMDKTTEKEGTKDWDKFPTKKGLNDEEYKGTALNDIKGFFGQGASEIPDVFFAVKNAEGKYVGKDGKVLAENLQDPKAEGFDKKAFEDAVLGGKTKADKGLVLDTSKLDQSKPTKYTIEEISTLSTYKNTTEGDKKDFILTSAKAVPIEITLPLVNGGGVVTEAHVYPKNTEDGPKIDKNFGKKDNTTKNETDNDLKHAEGFDEAHKDAGAQAGAKYENYIKTKETAKTELGRVIPYEVKTEIPVDSRLATAKWDDKMTEGLTYKEDLVVKYVVGTETTENTLKEFDKNDYNLTQDAQGFVFELKESGLEKINGQKEAVTVYLQYNATVNNAAMADIPESNNVMFHYGNTPNHGTTPLPTNPTKDGDLTIEKSWDDGVWKEGESATFELRDANTGKKVTADDLVFKEIENESKTDRDARKAEFDKYKESFNAEVTIGYEKKDGDQTQKKDHTWNYLDPSKEYIAVEIKSTPDSDAAYTKQTEDGKIVVVNYPSTNPSPKNPTSPKVVLGGKRFVKTNQDGSERLAGAEFYVKKTVDEKELYLAAKTSADEAADAVNVSTEKGNLDTAVKAYNDASKKYSDKLNELIKAEKWDTTAQLEDLGTFENKEAAEKAIDKKLAELSKAIDTAQKAYNDAFVKAAQMYKWEDKKDNAVVLVSDGQGRFEITGLEYGNYKLEEKKAPEGFATLTEDVPFEVKKGSYKGENTEFRYTEEIKAAEGEDLTDQQKADNDKTSDVFGKQVPNKKVSIPQTGGIGSLIFIVAGLAIMGIAFVAMKKRNAVEA